MYVAYFWAGQLETLTLHVNWMFIIGNLRWSDTSFYCIDLTGITCMCIHTHTHKHNQSAGSDHINRSHSVHLPSTFPRLKQSPKIPDGFIQTVHMAIYLCNCMCLCVLHMCGRLNWISIDWSDFTGVIAEKWAQQEHIHTSNQHTNGILPIILVI